MQSVHTLLKLALLRWTGQVTRMPDKRLPKKILYGDLQVGKRSHAGQKKWYKDTLKASLKDFNISTESWEQIAQDRTKWRGLIRRGAGELVNTKQKESAKPSRNVHSGKPELRHHQQSFLPQPSLVLSATGSLELRLVSSAILEHRNNNISQSWLGLVIVSNDRQTNCSTTMRENVHSGTWTQGRLISVCSFVLSDQNINFLYSRTRLDLHFSFSANK